MPNSTAEHQMRFAVTTERNFRAALALQTELYGEQSAEAAATLSDLGVLVYRQQNLEEAGGLLEKAVAFYRAQQQSRAPDYDPAKLALALDYLGAVKIFQGDFKASLSLLTEAQQLSAGANLRESERWVRAFNKADLGNVLVALGDTARGVSLTREAVAEYRELSPEPRWEVAPALSTLGMAARNRHQPDEALKYLLEGEQVFRQTLGDKNGYLAVNLSWQALVLMDKNDLEAAEAKAREASAIAQAVASGENFNASAPALALGQICLKAGRGDEAEVYLRQALAIYEAMPKKNAYWLAGTKMLLSQALMAQRRQADAERVGAEARDEARDALGDDSPVTKAAEANLAKIQAPQGK